jgi:hypothetical protein
MALNIDSVKGRLPFRLSPGHIPKHVQMRADCAAQMRAIIERWKQGF